LVLRRIFFLVSVSEKKADATPRSGLTALASQTAPRSKSPALTTSSQCFAKIDGPCPDFSSCASSSPRLPPPPPNPPAVGSP
jgi:hypothetical protein